MKHMFTQEEDDFIITYRPTMGTMEIAMKLGLTKEQIKGRVARLRKMGYAEELDLKGDPRGRDPMAHQEIKDGYDNVPWWCRVSTRCQTQHIQ